VAGPERLPVRPGTVRTISEESSGPASGMPDASPDRVDGINERKESGDVVLVGGGDVLG